MKLLIAVILSIILLGNSLKTSFINSWYVLDMNSFIEQLCENKNNVKVECNGKCFLSKINKDSSTNESTPFSAIEFDQLIYYKTTNTEFFKVFFYSTKEIIFYREFNYKETSINTIFHPPKIS